MALTSEEIIRCNSYFRENNVGIEKMLTDSALDAFLAHMKKKISAESRQRLQEKIMHNGNITPLEFTVALSGYLWREDMDRRAQTEGVVFNTEGDAFDQAATRHLTPAEAVKLRDIYHNHSIATRGVTIEAIHEACLVLYSHAAPTLVHSVLLLMPSRVTLARFLQTSSAIRENTDDRYRQSMGVDDEELKKVALYRGERRDSKARPAVDIPPPAAPTDSSPGSPKYDGSANDTESYRREFGLSTQDVLTEAQIKTKGVMSYDDVVIAKKTFDEARLQYGTHLQAVRIKAMFKRMGRDVSDGGIRTVTHLLNTIKQIHIRDFVLLLSEVIAQDGPRLQAQKEEEYQKSMGVDAQEVASTKEFGKKAMQRKQSVVRRQSIGDVLTNVAVDASVKMQNDVEEFRHEFGVFEEPEELLESCHGMLQVQDLVEAKKFYYNHGLHNNNKRFTDHAATKTFCEQIEERGKLLLTPATEEEYRNLTAVWREKFLTLSFFEFVTTLASYLRSRQRVAEATKVSQQFESIKQFKAAAGHAFTEEEQDALMSFARNRNERGGSIIGLKSLTRRGSTAKSASEYFRDLTVSGEVDEEDKIASDRTHNVLTPEEVHKLKLRLREKNFTPWKVHVMISEIGREISQEGQESLCGILAAHDHSLVDAACLIASYLSHDAAHTLRKEIDTYKHSMGVGNDEESSLRAFKDSSFYRHSGIKLKVEQDEGEGPASPVNDKHKANDPDEYRREFGVTSRDVCNFLSKKCHGELRTADCVKLKSFFSANADEKNITDATIDGALKAINRTLSPEGQKELLSRCQKMKRVMFEDFACMLGLQLNKVTHEALKMELGDLILKSPTGHKSPRGPSMGEANEMATLLLQCGNHFTQDELNAALSLYKALRMENIEDKWHLVSYLSGIKRHCTDATIDMLNAQRHTFRAFPTLILAISNSLSREERAFRERQMARLRDGSGI
jgi:hypothetical protein